MTCLTQKLIDLPKWILANSWFSLRANKRLYRETEGLSLKAGLSYEIHRTERNGPDMHDRIASYIDKNTRAPGKR
jgi:enoyl-CoA hydratase